MSAPGTSPTTTWLSSKSALAAAGIGARSPTASRPAQAAARFQRRRIDVLVRLVMGSGRSSRGVLKIPRHGPQSSGRWVHRGIYSAAVSAPDSPVAPSDRELLDACRKGDQAAWD